LFGGSFDPPFLIGNRWVTGIHALAAAETAHPAQNLPDGAAIRIAVGVASKKEHLAIPPVQYLSREDR